MFVNPSPTKLYILVHPTFRLQEENISTTNLYSEHFTLFTHASNLCEEYVKKANERKYPGNNFFTYGHDVGPASKQTHYCNYYLILSGSY